MRVADYKMAFQLIAMVALVFPPYQLVHAQSLPPQAQADIDNAIKDCKPQKVVFGKNFIVRKDINGDGIPDLILDYGEFKCGNNSTLYCGSAGCTTTVYASISRYDYVKVLDDNIRGVVFKSVNGKPVMMLNLHGSSCGKSGSTPCNKTLYWSGSNFIGTR